MPDCTVTGCTRQTESPGGLRCAMHKKRMQRGMDPNKPVQEKLSPFSQFVEACLALADAPAEDDPAYDRALDVTRKAACAWMRSMGWAPTETESVGKCPSRRAG